MKHVQEASGCVECIVIHIVSVSPNRAAVKILSHIKYLDRRFGLVIGNIRIIGVYKF
jgi:hypothetical protein